MSSQEWEYFPFRFYRTLVLLILFMSPTTPTMNTISVPESFLKLASASITSQSNNEFNKFIIEYLESRELSEFAIQDFRRLIEKIPPEIANSPKGSLFIVSVHLICFINQLYNQSDILAEECKRHRDILEQSRSKMENVLHAIETEIDSMITSTDFATLHKRIAIVMEILNDFHTKLEQVSNDIKNGIIKSRHGKPLAIGYGVASAVVCVGSFFVGSPFRRVLTSAIAAGAVSYSINSFFSLAKTNEELNQLQRDTNMVRLELAEHRTQLQVKLALMKELPKEIYIKSEGCEDPNVKRTENTCGFAYIKVNGIDFSPRGRGYNVVVVDGRTGGVLEKKTFDTNRSPPAGDRLKEYLDGLNGNKIVLVAIQDEGSKFMKSALDALKRLGATEPVVPDYQGSFAFVGYAGENKPSWIAQKSAKRGQGPSEIFLKIP